MAREISRQFKTRQVEKNYLALLLSEKTKIAVGDTGVIDVPVVKTADGWMTVVGDANDRGGDAKRFLYREEDSDVSGKRYRSISKWEVLLSSKESPLSLVKFCIQTGVKHQIRLHAASVLGAPILGDQLYNKRKFSTTSKDGIFLHASSLAFYRYYNGSRHTLKIHAPVPEKFTSLLEAYGMSDAIMSSPLTSLDFSGGLVVDDNIVAHPGQSVDIPEIMGRWLG